jgi:hypothetical protein
MKMVRFFGGAVLVLLISGAAMAGQDSLKDTLLAREVELMEAIKQHDREALRQLLSQQAYAVRLGSGRVTTDRLLQDLDDVTLTSYSIRDVDCVRICDNAAMLTYEFTSTRTKGGVEAPPTTCYATVTWALRDGQWMSIFYQETPLGQGR